jgi:hypothetical protein
MLIHTVFFWLKAGLTEAERAEFRRGVESLGAIKHVERAYVGAPAPVPARPVTDQTFCVGLTMICEDAAAHEAYQTDPIHRAFVAKFQHQWMRVQVYDFEEAAAAGPGQDGGRSSGQGTR